MLTVPGGRKKIPGARKPSNISSNFEHRLRERNRLHSDSEGVSLISSSAFERLEAEAEEDEEEEGEEEDQGPENDPGAIISVSQSTMQQWTREHKAQSSKLQCSKTVFRS